MADIPLWMENRFLLNITCCSVLHYIFGLCCIEVVALTLHEVVALTLHEVVALTLHEVVALTLHKVVALTLHEVVFRSVLSPAGENASLSWVTH